MKDFLFNPEATTHERDAVNLDRRSPSPNPSGQNCSTIFNLIWRLMDPIPNPNPTPCARPMARLHRLSKSNSAWAHWNKLAFWVGGGGGGEGGEYIWSFLGLGFIGFTFPYFGGTRGCVNKLLGSIPYVMEVHRSIDNGGAPALRALEALWAGVATCRSIPAQEPPRPKQGHTLPKP